MDLGAVEALGVADVADRHVVVLAPEERHVATPRARPSIARATAWPWRTATCQCSMRTRSPSPRIARDVAGRPHARRGAQLGRRRRRRDRSQARPTSRARGAGATPTPITTRSAASVAAVVEHDRVGGDLAPACGRAGTRRPCPRARGARTRRPRRRARARAAPPRAPTTVTSTPRARSDAATSSPMKLAPTITTRPRAAAAIARLSASVRSVWTCGRSAPSIGSRIGSAPVATSSASYGSSRPLAVRDGVRRRVDRGRRLGRRASTSIAASASAVRRYTHSSGALPAR